MNSYTQRQIGEGGVYGAHFQSCHLKTFIVLHSLVKIKSEVKQRKENITFTT